MQVQMLTADAAENGDGRVSALGLGWQVTTTPTPPMAVVLVFIVPWDEAGEKFEFVLKLLTADGHSPQVGVSSTGKPVFSEIAGSFVTSRPPSAPQGVTQRHPFSISAAEGMQLNPGEIYEWRLEVNGESREEWSLPFYVKP